MTVSRGLDVWAIYRAFHSHVFWSSHLEVGPTIPSYRGTPDLVGCRPGVQFRTSDSRKATLLGTHEEGMGLGYSQRARTRAKRSPGQRSRPLGALETHVRYDPSVGEGALHQRCWSHPGGLSVPTGQIRKLVGNEVPKVPSSARFLDGAGTHLTSPTPKPLSLHSHNAFTELWAWLDGKASRMRAARSTALREKAAGWKEQLEGGLTLPTGGSSSC